MLVAPGGAHDEVGHPANREKRDGAIDGTGTLREGKRASTTPVETRLRCRSKVQEGATGHDEDPRVGACVNEDGTLRTPLPVLEVEELAARSSAFGGPPLRAPASSAHPGRRQRQATAASCEVASQVPIDYNTR